MIAFIEGVRTSVEVVAAGVRTPKDIGDERLMELKFSFGASLRLSGRGLDCATVTNDLGVIPTFQRHQSECGAEQLPTWILDSGLPESMPLSAHLQALSQVVLPNLAVIKALPESVTSEFYCWYHTNSHTGGVSLDDAAVRVIGACGLPVGLSVVTMCDAAFDNLPEG